MSPTPRLLYLPLCPSVFFLPLNSYLEALVCCVRQEAKYERQIIAQSVTPQAKGIYLFGWLSELGSNSQHNTRGLSLSDLFPAFLLPYRRHMEASSVPEHTSSFYDSLFWLMLVLPPGFHVYSSGTHMQMLRSRMDIIFSLKPSWTSSLFRVPRALGPCFITSAVTVLPCLIPGFLRTVTDVVTVSTFTQ